MQVITTVTQKGQITIPKKLREDLGVSEYSKVKIEEGDGFIKVTPTFDILDIAGTFIPKKGKDVLKAREAIERSYSRI